MSDLHERFGAWLTDGARVELPRDVALHASACEACLRDATAFDALLAIDPGAAPLPSLAAGRSTRHPAPSRVLRSAMGVAAVLAVAVSAGIGAGALLDRRAELGAPITSPTPDGEGILAGAGGPSDSPAAAQPDATTSAGPSESADASSDPEPSDHVGPTSVPAVSTPRPAVAPRPTAITPPIGTPRPSTPSTATPAPTASPSAPPSSTPPVDSPSPAPTPPPTLVPTPLPTDTPPPPPPSEGP